MPAPWRDRHAASGRDGQPTLREPTVFVVTDIETDGPDPGANSMLSLASVARGEAGEDHGSFVINLRPLEGAGADPDTMRFWERHPEAFAASTSDQRPPEQAIAAYCTWIRSLPGRPVFVAHPLTFDGRFVDWYLQAFQGIRLHDGPWSKTRLFHGTGLDLPSLIAGRLGWDYLDCKLENYPESWLGGHAHSHLPLDDALGYAHLLVQLRRGALG